MKHKQSNKNSLAYLDHQGTESTVKQKLSNKNGLGHLDHRGTDSTVKHKQSNKNSLGYLDHQGPDSTVKHKQSNENSWRARKVGGREHERSRQEKVALGRWVEDGLSLVLLFLRVSIIY